MRALYLIVVLLLAVQVSSVARAEENKLVGTWEAGDRAHQAIYGFLKASPSHISFSLRGKKWECKTKYEIVDSGSGETYPDQPEVFQRVTKDRKWEYLKIHLGPSKCTSSPYFLFAFPSDIANYADFVDYLSESKYTGWGHFRKLTKED